MITSWALDSYLGLKHSGVLPRELYFQRLRPDILRLRALGQDPRFKDARFWGPAKCSPSETVPDGFKMKWHNLGNGNVQLRLCIGLVDGDAFLCQGFKKTSPGQDFREGFKLMERIRLIRQQRHVEKGAL
ncbi:MAG: hypothetical protein H6739_33390 [Alphaproteobacteria bacterium]|nr:hypothetical protein [Alphaproteobacteria bacterium]